MSYNLTNKVMTSDQNYYNSYKGGPYRYETSTSIQPVQTDSPCLGTKTDAEAGVPQRS